MTQPNRIADIDPAAATPEQAEILDRLGANRGRIPTPYRIWLHAPAIAAGMEAIGTYINGSSSFSEPELELAILATAVHWGSPYVMVMHTRHALRSGLAPEIVEAILAKGRVETADARLQLLADFVADALAGGEADDAAFARYEQSLGRRGVAEGLAIVGYFTAVSIAMRMHAVPVPA